MMKFKSKISIEFYLIFSIFIDFLNIKTSLYVKQLMQAKH